MPFNESALQNITPTATTNTSTSYQSYLVFLCSISVVGVLLCKLRILNKPAISKFFNKFKSTPGREDPAAFDPFEDMGRAYELESQKRRPFY